MKIHEAMMKLGIEEELVEIRRREQDRQFDMTIIEETGEFVVGNCIGQVDTPMAGLVLAVEKRYNGNKPRLIYVSENRVFAAFSTVKLNKYLCHVYYEGCNGHGRREIYAPDPQAAFVILKKEIADDISPEEESKPRLLFEQVSRVVIEASRPLRPDQHPDTPPLWYAVAEWKPKRTVVTEWVTVPTDEDQKAADAIWAQAFAQSVSPPGMKAVVTGETEFGCTGSCIPTWNE